MQNELIKLANASNKDVVKIAGILSKIKNWFKKHLDSDYAEEIDNLRLSTKDYSKYVREISEALNNLDQSIKNLDVGSYHTNLKQVQSLLPEFISKMQELGMAASDADRAIPQQVKQITIEDNPREPLGPEPQRIAPAWNEMETPKVLTELGAFKDVIIKSTPLTNTKKAIKTALENLQWTPTQISKILRGDDRNPLFIQFKQAIKGGTVKAIRQAPPGKEQIKQRPETDVHYLVEIDPFVIPNTNIILRANVIVRDKTDAPERNLELYGVQNQVFYAEEVNAPMHSQFEEPLAPEYDESEQLQNEAEADAWQAQYDADDKDIDVPLFRSASKKQRTKILKTALQKSDYNNIHQWARDVLYRAFRQVMGREPTLGELQAVQAVAWLESNYGRGWKGPGKNSNNWGAIQYQGGPRRGKPTETGGCPPGSFYQQDSYPTEKGSVKFYWCYKSYPTPEAGAADLIRTIYKSNRAAQEGPYKGQLTRAEGTMNAVQRGSLKDFSSIMYDTSYYGGFGKTREQRIKGHMKKMQDSIDKITAALHEESFFNKPQETPTQDQLDYKDEFKDAMIKLLASSDNSLTNIVRKSLEKKALPVNKFLIKIHADQVNLNNKLLNNAPVTSEFARILSSALREELDAKTTIYNHDNSFEIECEATGNALTLSGAIQEVSNNVTKEFTQAVNNALKNIKVGNIKTSIHVDSSELKPLSVESALKNQRLFSYAMVNI